MNKHLHKIIFNKKRGCMMAVAEHAADSEGELLARLRAIVGPKLPIVASLDLHANVTHRMLREADALVSYRTYPHVDMAATGELAEHLDAAGPGPVRRAGRAGQAPWHGAELLHGFSGQRFRRVRADGLGPW